MDRKRQIHLAEAFRARHQAPHLLLLANAWCVSAWNKDPVFGVIGIQSGPRG